LLLGFTQEVGNLHRRGRVNGGCVSLSTLAPFGGAALGVYVEQSSGLAVKVGTNGKMGCYGAFAAASFPAQ
jgi:hypothetical protein